MVSGFPRLRAVAIGFAGDRDRAAATAR